MSLTLITPIAAVSCNGLSSNNISSNQENSTSNNSDVIENLELKLNSEGKKLTVTEFYNGGLTSLEKYTNYLDLVATLEAKNHIVEFSTFVIDNNIIKVVLLIDGKEGVFFLSGFKANSSCLEEFANKFNLTLLETTKQKSSIEIYESFINGNKLDRNLVFMNNFELSTGKIWLDADGLLKYVVPEISEDPININIIDIEWNKSETNETLKRSQLEVEFEFSYFEGNKKYAIYRSYTFSGFMSFKNRFDMLADEFSNQVILANKGLLIPTEEIIQEFNNQDSSEKKLEVLKKYTNISEMIGFASNTISSFKAIVNKISLNETYDGVLDFECDLVWAGMKKTPMISAYNFNYVNNAAENIKNKLTSIQLQPTAEGKNTSSIIVKEEFIRFRCCNKNYKCYIK